jgi:hypothetical protein
MGGRANLRIPIKVVAARMGLIGVESAVLEQ